MRRITNVAAGSDANDAATVGQLEKVAAQKGSWQLTAGKTNATTVDGDHNTVDFSAGSDGNLSVSKTADSNNVTIGLKKDVTLGAATSGNGGSLDVYRVVADANSDKETNPKGHVYDQLGSHVRIDGSTVSVHYDNGTGNSDARGVVLGVANDSYADSSDSTKTVNSPLGYVYLQDGDNYYYIHGAMNNDTDYQGRLVYNSSKSGYNYIANLEDGISFSGDAVKAGSTTTNTTADTRLDPKALNHALSITGGATDTTNLTTGNIGVVTTPTEYDGTVNNGVKTAGGLSIQLAKDLKGITSIANGADGSGAKITLGTSGTTISGGDVDVSKNKITNLKNGEADTDAATVGQMNTAIDNAKTKYYSVQKGPQIAGFSTNEKSDGASDSAWAGLAAGYETGTAGIGSTVVGSYSGVMNEGTSEGTDLRGAASISLGTLNLNQSTSTTAAGDNKKPYSGVANSIIGQGNMTTDSNAALIFGAGNTVSNSYRNVDIDTSTMKGSTPSDLESALQSAVPKSGAQVMVMGGGNNITRAYMTQVIGVGNTITGKDATYAEDTSTQYNYVDGSNNTLTNGKGDYIIGANNSVTGDSITTNQSNIVVGDNHTLSNKSNNVVIGSADSKAGSQKELAASDAVVIGHNADVQKDGGVAIGSESVASVDKGEKGYDATTLTQSTDTTGTWKATNAAVSVGKADGTITRQITGVAAGTNDTDAVNVAQIKKLASINASNIGANLKKADGTAAEAADVTKNKEAWATAIGTGTVTKDDDGSKQLVTGGTVYTETHPTANGNYIQAADSAATNLSTLDTHVKANADKLSDMDNSSVKYDTKTVGDKTTVDKTKITLAGGTTGTTITNVKSALNGAADISKVTEGLTNAVNLSDLQTAYNTLDKKAKNAHTALTVENGTKANEEAGQYAGKNIQLHSDTDANGKVTYDVKLAKDLTGITSISGGTDDNGAKITLDEKGKNISVNNGKITNLTAGEADDDAATVKQVNDKVSAITYTAGNGIVMDKDAKTISAKAGKGITVDAGGINVNAGNHLSVGTDGKVNVGDNGEVAEKDTNLVTGGTVYDALHGGLDNIVIGKPGKDGAAGTPGTIGLVGPAGTNGKDGMVAIKIQKGTDDADKGIKGANGVDGKDGITRIVYTDAAGDHQAATVEDGLKFAGDDGQTATDKVIAKKLNNTIDIIGGADSTKLTDKNIGVNNVGGQLKVQLAKDLTGISSISGGTDDNGAKITLDEKGKNISVNNGKITNLTAGEADDDAATVKQVNDKVSAITYTAGNGIVMDKDAKTISAKAGKGITVDAGGINVNAGNHLSVGTDGKVNVGDNGEVAEKDTNLVTGGTVYDALHGGLDNIVIGKPGKDGAAGTPGTIGLVGPAGTNGKDGMVAIKIQKGTDDADKGIKGANGVDGKNGITRIVYTDAAGDHQAATMEDGLKFAGDDGQKDASKVIAKKLNNTVDIIGGATGTLTEGNIGVNNENGKLKVQLAKDLMGIASISNQTTSGTTATGAKIELSTDGKTTISGGDVSVSNNKVTNLKDGDLSDKSTDAVTGKQLYQEQQDRIKAIGTLSKDKYNYIDKTASVSDNLDKLDTQVKTNADAIDGLKTRVDTLDGDAVKYDKDSSKGKITLEGKDGTTITNLKDGSIAENGKDAVNGGQLYTEQEARKAEDQKINDKIGTLNKDTYNYIDKAASVSDNLDKLDTQAKTNADAISKETQDRKDAIAAVDKKIGSLDKDGNYIKKDDSISKNLSTLDGQVKTNADNIANNTKAISEIKTTVNDLSDNAVQYDKDSNKSKVTLAGKDGTTIANVKDGSVAKDSKDAVNGGQLFDEQTARENADKEIRTDITNIKDGEGFTDKGKTVIKSLAQDAVDVVGGDNVTVTSETQNDKKTFTVKVDGNGKVASGDKGLISGDTIYNELRPTSDGSYIRTDQTTARNLTNLDTQVKKNSDLINSDGSTIKIGSKDAATKIDVSDKDGNGRTITGVVTDGSDTSSAANVGYVNDVAAANTQQIYRDMNSAYGHLNNNINKAAAGSNALAALHPLDYDPADKASYAVGYGHYRNANAAAVGAFYQPNANTMVSVGVSMGNGDPGVNAGVSFKVGKGSAYNGVSKAQMAETIAAQEKQISEIKASDVAKDQRIDSLEKENQEMKKQIQEILAKLGK